MNARFYNPHDWFWIVGGDESRFWSSAAGAYIETLPEGAGTTRIDTEENLTDVLAAYALPGPIVRVPDRVSSRQFKMQLQIDGLLTSVQSWIATQSELVQIAYHNSGTFVRGEPMMAAGFAALGFSEERGDRFFTDAAQI